MNINKREIVIFFVVLIILLGFVLYFSFIQYVQPKIRENYARLTLDYYASQGITPIHLTNQTNDTILTYIGLETYAQGWCKQLIELNYDEICGK